MSAPFCYYSIFFLFARYALIYIYMLKNILFLSKICYQTYCFLLLYCLKLPNFAVPNIKRYKIMKRKRIVVTFDCKYKQAVRAYLVSARAQYSLSVDNCTGVVRVSVPYAQGVRLLAVLLRSFIPFETI